MPSFICQVCRASFEVAQTVLDKYPGWQPKYCRLHSPKKKAATRPVGRSSRGGADRGRTLREENLTLAQVLAKYENGPDRGVFTDGSAVPNPGPGGWGVVWVENGEIVSKAHGHEPDTTNNRMELRALIEAFTMLPADAEIDVLSDSELCVNTITRWAPAWERAGWKRKARPDQEPGAGAGTAGALPRPPGVQAEMDRRSLRKPLERVRGQPRHRLDAVDPVRAGQRCSLALRWQAHSDESPAGNSTNNPLCVRQITRWEFDK